jgi:uncharacterized membrane protein (UPF0127 family)
VKIAAHIVSQAALLLLIGSAPSRPGAAETPLELASFAQTSVDIASVGGRQHFDVWVADTAERQTQGLMFVRDLPAGRGMLFIERQARPMAFWMKNTYIELDMLFIGADRRILKIASRAPPLSLATIDSGGPVIAVLEIKGGEAARRAIHVRDPVSWP